MYPKIYRIELYRQNYGDLGIAAASVPHDQRDLNQLLDTRFLSYWNSRRGNMPPLIGDLLDDNGEVLRRVGPLDESRVKVILESR